MTTYYKAVRMDYTDFKTGKVNYAVGETVIHPNPHRFDASGYLSVTTDPTDVPGCSWPLRLLEVEVKKSFKPPVDHGYDNKRCTHELTVLREIDAWDYFGPAGKMVVEMSDEYSKMSWIDREDLNYRLYNSRIAAVHLPISKRQSSWDMPVRMSGHYRIKGLVEAVSLYDHLGPAQDIVGEALDVWDAFMNRGFFRRTVDRIKAWWTLT